MKNLLENKLVIGGMVAIIVVAVGLAVMRNMPAVRYGKSGPLPAVAQVMMPSLAELDRKVAEGFTHIQVPLNFTADRRVVCMHAWKDAGRVFKDWQGNKPMAMQGFNKRPTHNGERPCTLPTLVEWAKAHPSVTLVTNVFGNNNQFLRVHQQLAKNVPHAKKQFVAQVFAPRQFAALKKMGYEKIMWGLYRFRGNRKVDVVENVVRNNRFYAVSVPLALAKNQKLMSALQSTRAPLYLHTVRDCAAFKFAQDKGFNGQIMLGITAEQCAAQTVAPVIDPASETTPPAPAGTQQ